MTLQTAPEFPINGPGLAFNGPVLALNGPAVGPRHGSRGGSVDLELSHGVPAVAVDLARDDLRRRCEGAWLRRG